MKVVVERTAKKIISLKVDEQGVLHVLANNRLSLEKIKAHLESKREWISEQLKKCSSQGANVNSANEVVPSTLPSAKQSIAEMFSGKKCLLCGDVVLVKPTVENKSYLEDNTIYIPEKCYAHKDLRLKALKSYLKKLSSQTVPDEISRFGSCASLCPTRIEFRNISNGWVKCSNPDEKIISLDFRICQLPPELQHFLIVHAFAHFKHEGHDAPFWNLVSNYLPRYKTYVEEILHFGFLKEI